jgi:hypothetical protein
MMMATKMINKPYRLFALTLCTAVCNTFALHAATLNRSTADSKLGLPTHYESTGAAPLSSESRIDFINVVKSLGGIRYIFSNISDSKDKRERSEFGGVAQLKENGKFIGFSDILLYIPRPAVSSWNDKELRCSSKRTGEQILTSCIWSITGTKYESLYTKQRGFVWFDQPCKTGKNGVCRYVLMGKSGVFSQEMVDNLFALRRLSK